MIKRIWFPPARHGDAPPWRLAVDAPAPVAPVRITESVALPELEPEPLWAQLGAAWFRDVEHVVGFDVWGGASSDASLLVEEVVLRGADWLGARWCDGGARLKHVALARRAAGVSAADFSQRWRAHAGSVGSTPIPDRARGQAYVQDHPLSDDPAYDAITEVWFDDEADLRARVEWMAEALAADPPDDLFGERHLLAVREAVL